MADKEPQKKYLLVPTNPDNFFNDPWNVGVLGGAITGLLAGYMMSGHILPFARRLFSSALIGDSKLALVVNSELKMSPGKTASQCSHASVLAYKQLQSLRNSRRYGAGLLVAWEMTGQKKVVLRARNHEAMLKIEKIAKESSIPVCRVKDAGRTEVAPGSITVLAVGPANVNDIDHITGDLRLY